MLRLLALLLTLPLPCCCVHTQLGIEEQIRLCPAVPDLQPFFQQIPPLGRRLRVAAPCIGVHTGGHAFDVMKVPEDTINAYDLEAGYYAALHQQLKASGMEHIVLNLGTDAGDLMNVAFKSLQTPVDVLIAGPPCPPFSGQGSRRGLKDPRAKVKLPISSSSYNF
jgi:hypothetical protein